MGGGIGGGRMGEYNPTFHLYIVSTSFLLCVPPVVCVSGFNATVAPLIYEAGAETTTSATPWETMRRRSRRQEEKGRDGRENDSD